MESRGAEASQLVDGTGPAGTAEGEGGASASADNGKHPRDKNETRHGSPQVEENFSGIYWDEWQPEIRYLIHHSEACISISDASSDSPEWREGPLVLKNNNEIELWNMTASFKDGRISWSNGSHWSKVQEPDESRKQIVPASTVAGKAVQVFDQEVESKLEKASALWDMASSVQSALLNRALTTTDAVFNQAVLSNEHWRQASNQEAPKRDGTMKVANQLCDAVDTNRDKVFDGPEMQQTFRGMVHEEVPPDAEKRLKEKPIQRWTEDDVSFWFAVLSRDDTLAFPVEDLDWEDTRQRARNLKIDGTRLQTLDAEGWQELGIRHPIVRIHLMSKVSEVAKQGAEILKKPANFQGQIRLNVKVKIIAVWDIDTVSQTFYCHFVVVCTTEGIRDIKTAKGVKIHSGNWEPRLRFLNQISTDTWHCSDQLTENGELQFTIRVEGQFSESYQLKNFPFDTQKLTLKMSTSHRDRKDGSVYPLAFAFDKESKVETNNFGASNVWSLQDWIEAAPELDEERPVLLIKMTARRYCGSYLWNVYFPLMLINLMCLTVWAVAYDDPGSRLQISLAMVLIAVAFKTQISDYLPRISYITTLDWYVIFSFVFQALVVAENGIMGLMARRYGEEEHDALVEADKWMGFVFLFLFCFLHIVAGSDSFCKLSTGKRKIASGTGGSGKRRASKDHSKVHPPLEDVTQLTSTTPPPEKS
mmetsp:Transcript_85964/g.149758  ORF Transcript_85964/g.149758 Transcript_85964/m.149758 type:complete len:703 (-) Transcript_85964:74-2182(-)